VAGLFRVLPPKGWRARIGVVGVLCGKLRGHAFAEVLDLRDQSAAGEVFASPCLSRAERHGVHPVWREFDFYWHEHHTFTPELQ
jgi:hypothetical protein